MLFNKNDRSAYDKDKLESSRNIIGETSRNNFESSRNINSTNNKTANTDRKIIERIDNTNNVLEQDPQRIDKNAINTVRSGGEKSVPNNTDRTSTIDADGVVMKNLDKDKYFTSDKRSPVPKINIPNNQDKNNLRIKRSANVVKNVEFDSNNVDDAIDNNN